MAGSHGSSEGCCDVRGDGGAARGATRSSKTPGNDEQTQQASTAPKDKVTRMTFHADGEGPRGLGEMRDSFLLSPGFQNPPLGVERIQREIQGPGWEPWSHQTRAAPAWARFGLPEP